MFPRDIFVAIVCTIPLDEHADAIALACVCRVAEGILEDYRRHHGITIINGETNIAPFTSGRLHGNIKCGQNRYIFKYGRMIESLTYTNNRVWWSRSDPSDEIGVVFYKYEENPMVEVYVCSGESTISSCGYWFTKPTVNLHAALLASGGLCFYMFSRDKEEMERIVMEHYTSKSLLKPFS